MNVVRLAGETDFKGWRSASRRLLLDGVPPEDVDWVVGAQESLFEGAGEQPAAAAGNARFSVPALFMRLAESLVLHRDPQRFALLYRMLWRLREEPRLLAVASDADVARARLMKQGIARDIHKMHAYVRFRQASSAEGIVYIAWFEPTHYILEAAAPFFVRRFAAMGWSILTPYASAYWDGDSLHLGPGAARSDAPDGDVLEALWRSYYKSIFNPARLKLASMQGQMPKKYWANLPEAELIPSLVNEASARAGAMIAAGASQPRRRIVKYAVPQTATPAAGSLEGVRTAAADCRGCPLWEHATQTVFGAGPARAQVMFVGEQPGDHEDLAGKPFVGPAGRVFDRAIAAAGLQREAVYVTNAVKHFKFEPRGKRRIHKTPAEREIEACNRWLEQELALVAPRLVVAMGGTALRALTGLAAGVQSVRGRVMPWRPGIALLVTVHPASLLRSGAEAAAALNEYQRFVADLALAQPFVDAGIAHAHAET